MKLDKKSLDILKYLYREKRILTYVIENFLGEDELTFQNNAEFQKIIKDLVDAKLIEFEDGIQIHKIDEIDGEEIVSKEYVYEPAKARITITGVSILTENSKVNYKVLIPILIALCILIVSVMNLLKSENPDSIIKLPPTNDENIKASDQNSEAKLIDGKSLDMPEVNLGETNNSKIEIVLTRYKMVRLFNDSLFITLNSFIDGRSDKFNLKLSELNGPITPFNNITVGDVINFGLYNIKVLEIKGYRDPYEPVLLIEKIK